MPGRLPLYRPRRVWHVGDLDRPRPRSEGSYEGPGLSISECPEICAEIARLPGVTWELHRHDRRRGRFVDYLALSPAERAGLTAAAITAGLLTPTTWFRVTYRDDDLEDDRVMVFRDRSQAEAEATALNCDDSPTDDAPPALSDYDGYDATPAMHGRWAAHFSGAINDGQCEEMAHLMILADYDEYDGVWWHERHAPEALSAPRGVIFPAALGRWARRVAR